MLLNDWLNSFRSIRTAANQRRSRQSDASIAAEYELLENRVLLSATGFDTKMVDDSGDSGAMQFNTGDSYDSGYEPGAKEFNVAPVFYSGDEGGWIEFENGVVTIYGSNSDDTATVQYLNPSFPISLMVTLSNEFGEETKYYSTGVVAEVVFHGYDGDDSFDNTTSIQSTAYGDQGNDTLKGGYAIDHLYGSDGGDLIYGRSGNDVISGGRHFDIIMGGSGNDQIDGNEGIDFIHGQDGHDTIAGGDGDDHLFGNEGNDEIWGEDGNDWIYGHDDEDYLHGGDGNDFLDGGSQNDTLWGKAGNDTLKGNSGHDSLKGGDDDDSISGGSGNDYLEGYYGDDTLQGDDGNDSIKGLAGNDTLSGGDGDDTLKGGSGNDKVYGGDDEDLIYGNSGHDTLEGGWHNDTVYGGSGNDEIEGDHGHDDLFGNSDHDTIDGGTGYDYIEGDDGNDVLNGGSNGEDTLKGGSGHDTLDGGQQDDQLFGNSGNDLLIGGDGDDTLDGGDGYDTLLGDLGDDSLLGGNHDDTLRGGWGADTLEGEGGNDRLFGDQNESNAQSHGDLLKGGDGNDSLFGGFEGNNSKPDDLWGGPGADRFLVEVINYFGTEITDDVMDLTGEDAQINFRDNVEIVTKSGGEWKYFYPGQWTNEEIETVDVALGMIVELTDSTFLLKKWNGQELEPLTFVRTGQVRESNQFGDVLGPTDWDLLGVNSDQFGILLTYNAFFGMPENFVWETVLHEIGHNWDETDENPFVDDFRAVANWQKWSWNGAVQAADGSNWYYSNTWPGSWVNAYAQENPFEDFAETFAAYVMAESGLPFIGVGGNFADPESAASLQARLDDKFDVLDDMFESISDGDTWVFG